MERDFKGVWIPREIWLDDRLDALEKVILTEIDSLDQGEKGCYASNKYLSEFCRCSEWKVSNAVSKLCKIGYLETHSFDGRQRILKSLVKYTNQPCEFHKADLGNSQGRLGENTRQTCENPKADLGNSQDINIDNNTDTKPVNNTGRVKAFAPPTLEDVEAYCRERQNQVDPQHFIDYYESNGWRVGRNKMKDWKAAVRTWERNGYDKGKKPGYVRADGSEDLMQKWGVS